MNIVNLLEKAVEAHASDIFIVAGLPISYRANGSIHHENEEKLMPPQTKKYLEEIYELAGNRDINILEEKGDDDFSFALPGISRFRVSSYKQRGALSAVVRIITFDLPQPELIGIPQQIIDFSKLSKGLVLITGPAGSGKSTTLACIINEINKTQEKHIITLEDPIEFLHRHQKSIVSQREVKVDTKSYVVALRASLRQSPDVILLGEMRDYETIDVTMTAAETGHLVFSTLHTIGAANTIDRIIDVFPASQQRQIAVQLSMVLQAIVTQQLVPDINGELIPVFEIMTVTPAIRNMIRDHKIPQIDGILYASNKPDMISTDMSLLNLYKEGKITKETALNYATNEEMLKKNEGHEQFILHDGPPYANGEIHTGHALNKILKDTIVRYKNLRGYYTPYIPGFDTHGLPTEIKAINALGLNKDDEDVIKFRNTCRDFAAKYAKIQADGFKRLGVLADWEHPYITFQPEMEARQIGVFGAMYHKGYIYKGLKPVYWCADCETALAEAEIEYADDKATSIYVKFPLKDALGKFEEENSYMVIWTTTPWTLPGNMGITVGPEFEYSLVKAEKDGKVENYIIASELVERVMKLAEIEKFETVKTLKGTELEGMLCKHPFLDRDSRVVLGSEDTVDVDLAEGTGLVHTAPGYGKEDYLCGLKNKLDIVVTVDSKGHQTEGAGPFAGMFYAKSNKEIIKYLEENGLLLQKQELVHSYPHCWRCKKPIIYRPMVCFC